MKILELFDLEHTLAAKYLEKWEYPWELLGDVEKIILEIGQSLPEEEFERSGDSVWIARDAEISPASFISGPCIIGRKSQLKPGAYVRDGVLVGSGCVVGNSTEVKNSLLFDGVQLPHYNYVGDSILGHMAHLGAGAVTSNFRADHGQIIIRAGEESFETGRDKLGAMVGDFAEIGCNAVLNPGSIIGRNSVVYPVSCFRGVLPENSIYKTGGIVVKKRQE